MNMTKIQKLSGQCCALQSFKDRCTWDDAGFSVGADQEPLAGPRRIYGGYSLRVR